MSQKKVDAYKEAKKTRKQDIAKAKKAQVIRRVVAVAVLVLLVAALVGGVVLTIKNEKANERVDNYQASIFVLEDYAGLKAPKGE